MSTQAYSLCGQTDGRKKAFLQSKSIDLSYKLPTSYVGNVKSYKSVHHPISTRGNWEHPGNL